MTAREFGPGPHHWTLSADFEKAGGASVAGYGVIELTEPKSALGICAELLLELAGPDLAGLDAFVRFTIRPTTRGN